MSLLQLIYPGNDCRSYNVYIDIVLPSFTKNASQYVSRKMAASGCCGPCLQRAVRWLASDDVVGGVGVMSIKSRRADVAV